MNNRFFSTRERAQRSLKAIGYTWQESYIVGQGCYRNADGNRALIVESGSRSFDNKGKYWFMVRQWAT